MKKKKIAFIELETHATILIKWHELLIDIPEFEYHFFLHYKLKDKVEKLPDSKKTFINSLDEFKIDTYDLIIVNTFHRHFQDFNEIFKSNKVLCILHNLNFSLFFKSISLKNVITEKQQFLYFLKLYIKERISRSRRIISKSDFIAVLSKTLKDYSSVKIPDNRIEVLNLNYNKSHSIESSDKLKVVIPGNVSSKRKDFSLVFDVISQLNPVSKLEFIFLGSTREIKLKEKLMLLETKNSNKVATTFFENYVPEKEYNRIISSADILFCPIKSKTSFYWVDEFYGKTKVSGNESDCITYGKVGVFPESYPNFNWKTITYKNKDQLVQLFNNLDRDSISDLYANIDTFISRYTLNKVKKDIKDTLLTVINTND